VHNMCLVRPVLLYLNMHVLKMFYEQINGWMDRWMKKSTNSITGINSPDKVQTVSLFVLWIGSLKQDPT